jgi:hypothetical protein
MRASRKNNPPEGGWRCKNHPDKPALIRTDGASRGLCQECSSALMTRVRGSRSQEPRKTKPRKPRKGAIPPQEGLITLDFSEYQDLLTKLRNLAKEEYRPLEMEILFLLDIQTTPDAGSPHTSDQNTRKT